MLEEDSAPEDVTRNDLLVAWDRASDKGRRWLASAVLSLTAFGQDSDRPNSPKEPPNYNCEKRNVNGAWRRSTRSKSVSLPSIATDGDVNAVFRAVAIHPFLSEEPVLTRRLLDYGHVAVEGQHRRIIVLGLASETHYNKLDGACLDRLRLLCRTSDGEAADAS